MTDGFFVCVISRKTKAADRHPWGSQLPELWDPWSATNGFVIMEGKENGEKAGKEG